MCKGDDPNCVDFEAHRQAYRSVLSAERRAFLKSGFAATSSAAALATTGISLVSPSLAQSLAASATEQPAYSRQCRDGALRLLQPKPEAPDPRELR